MSASSHAKKAQPLLSNKTYTKLKYTAIVVLPAFGTLYFTLAQIWHLPRAEEVVGSLSALNVFIGALVSVSTRAYNKSDAKSGPLYVGDLVAEPHPNDQSKLMLAAKLNYDASVIAGMDEVVFKVK